MRMKRNNECKALSAMIGLSKIDNNGSYHHDPLLLFLLLPLLYWRLLFKSCFDPFPTNGREWAELTRKLVPWWSASPPKENGRKGNMEYQASGHFSADRIWDWQAYDCVFFSPSSFAVSGRNSSLHSAWLRPSIYGLASCSFSRSLT